MTDTSSLYDTLGLNESATQDEIRHAYRRLAQIHHPDKGGKEEVFKAISAAYEVLGNPEKRKLYDEGKLNANGQREPSEEEVAASALAGVFDALMNHEGDIIAMTRQSLVSNKKQMDMQLSSASQKLRRAERRLKHVVFKGKGTNLMKQVCERVVENCKGQVAHCEKQKHMIGLGLKLLAEYENTEKPEFEPHPAMNKKVSEFEDEILMRYLRGFKP